MNAGGTMSNRKLKKGILVYEIIGFMLVIATSWITALFDPPYLVSRTAFRPIDIYETSFETAIILVLCGVVVLLTSKLLNRLNYLEGFMVMCASCKKVRVDETWFSIERIISDNSELKISHSICPVCAERLYGIKQEKNEGTGEPL